MKGCVSFSRKELIVRRTLYSHRFRGDVDEDSTNLSNALQDVHTNASNGSKRYRCTILQTGANAITGHVQVVEPSAEAMVNHILKIHTSCRAQGRGDARVFLHGISCGITNNL